MKATIHPARLNGTLPVPPSKSMAHRLLIGAALAGGTSQIDNIDYSVDINATLGALRQLGARFSSTDSGESVCGGDVFTAAPTAPVDCAESGSTLRFLIPLFSLCGRPVTLTGAQRLLQRPLAAYAAIFERQGLPFAADAGGVRLCGPLRSGAFTLPGDVSSQFISGLLFALPLLAGDSVIRIRPPFESRDYVELTRKAQGLFGVHSRWQGEDTLLIAGGQHYAPAHSAVEGDWSQAAVPAVLGALGSGVRVSGLAADSAQGDKAVLDILRRCGAGVCWDAGTLAITPPAEGLRAPGEVSLAACPDLGPILCTLATFCRGTTRFVNAGRLRIKESDRIACVQAELAKLGAAITSTKDTITVCGGTPLHGGVTVQSHNDHRIVMALTAAAIGAGIEIAIEGAEAIRKSWPSFFEDIKALGAAITRSDA